MLYMNVDTGEILTYQEMRKQYEAIKSEYER